MKTFAAWRNPFEGTECSCVIASGTDSANFISAKFKLGHYPPDICGQQWAPQSKLGQRCDFPKTMADYYQLTQFHS